MEHQKASTMVSNACFRHGSHLVLDFCQAGAGILASHLKFLNALKQTVTRELNLSIFLPNRCFHRFEGIAAEGTPAVSLRSQRITTLGRAPIAIALPWWPSFFARWKTALRPLQNLGRIVKKLLYWEKASNTVAFLRLLYLYYVSIIVRLCYYHNLSSV